MLLRILSWNVHKCIGGLDRRYDPARIARIVAEADPDVVLLQEVAQDGTRYRGEKQVDVLGDLLGLEHRSYFVNVWFGRRRGAYGNAVLSRHPLTGSVNVDLTLPGRKARSVLHAALRLALPGGGSRTLHAFNLHLGLNEQERHEQLRRFLAAHPFAHLRHNTPVLVAGDFNDVWGSLGSALLTPAGFRSGRKPLRTFPAYAPVRALDGLYVRGDLDLVELRTLRGGSTRTASDHLPLLATVRLHP